MLSLFITLSKVRGSKGAGKQSRHPKEKDSLIVIWSQYIKRIYAAICHVTIVRTKPCTMIVWIVRFVSFLSAFVAQRPDIWAPGLMAVNAINH